MARKTADEAAKGTLAAASASPTLKDLRAAARGLLMMSESDRPLVPFAWSAEQVQGAKTPAEAVAKKVGIAPDALQVVDLATFFRPMIQPQDGWGEEEKQTAAHFQALIDQLKTLPQAAAHRVGQGPEIVVYVLGQDPAVPGGYAGVKTELVET